MRSMLALAVSVCCLVTPLLAVAGGEEGRRSTSTNRWIAYTPPQNTTPNGEMPSIPRQDQLEEAIGPGMVYKWWRGNAVGCAVFYQSTPRLYSSHFEVGEASTPYTPPAPGCCMLFNNPIVTLEDSGSNEHALSLFRFAPPDIVLIGQDTGRVPERMQYVAYLSRPATTVQLDNVRQHCGDTTFVPKLFFPDDDG